MTEKFLSFLWKYRLYDPKSLQLNDEPIEIIHPGEINTDSGPDFFNARIRINDTILAGNVEVHLKSSDWNKHGHHCNPAFANVILHIVDTDDMVIYDSNNSVVPTITLKFDAGLFDKYQSFITNNQWVPCEKHLSSVDSFIILSWLHKAGIERLEHRTSQITENLNSSVNDWEQAFYIQLARNFGFHVNSQPFEALARSIPYIILKKHSNNLTQLEALLFGQAGFLLDDYNETEYYRGLKTEYQFLAAKYNLHYIEPHLWKFLRLRPGNFPTIRIAQFASLIYKSTSLFSAVLEATSLEALLSIFTINVSEYWKNHYTFQNEAGYSQKLIGTNSINTIIINTVVPFYFIYGKKIGNEHFQEFALQILESMPAESNSTIENWKKSGVKPKNALDTQALLQIKNEYCDQKLCLDCGLGIKLLAVSQ